MGNDHFGPDADLSLTYGAASMSNDMFDPGKYNALRQSRVHRPEPVDTNLIRHVDRIDKYKANKGNVEVDRNYTADNPTPLATGPGSTTPTAPRLTTVHKLLALGLMALVLVISYLLGGTK